MRLRPALMAATVAALVVPSVAHAYTRLYGRVGPDTTITLKRADGTAVHRTRHGLKTFIIRDRGSNHNFHLVGRGVDRRTGIAFTGRRRWSPVRLYAGSTYRFYCEVHPTTMSKTFTVT